MPHTFTNAPQDRPTVAASFGEHGEHAHCFCIDDGGHLVRVYADLVAGRHTVADPPQRVSPIDYVPGTFPNAEADEPRAFDEGAVGYMHAVCVMLAANEHEGPRRQAATELAASFHDLLTRYGKAVAR